MHASMLLAAVFPLALLPGALGLGSARVTNKCPFEVFVWSVGSMTSAATKLAPQGGSYLEGLRTDAKTGGIALKVARTSDGLFTGQATLQFAYALNPNATAVYYSVSQAGGDFLRGEKMLVEGAPDNHCPPLEANAGSEAVVGVAGLGVTEACSSESALVCSIC